MKRLISFIFCLISGIILAQSINTSLTYTYHLPNSKKDKAPVLIMLHGYGSNETDLFEMHKSFDNRYAVFSLRAPFALSESGFCWYPLEISKDGVLKYDYKKVIESKKLILSFISNACKTYNLDSTCVVLFGFSQGAILSTDIAFTYPNKVKGIIALSGRLMPETQTYLKQPINWKNINKVKMHFAHGYSDNVIKFEEAEKIEKLIKEKQLTNSKCTFYKMAHNICGEELNDIKKWLSGMVSTKPDLKTK